MTATLIILCAAAVLFISGRIRSDLVAICTALSLVLCGIITPEEALSGFSNNIVIMMAGLFIVGGGIFSTGLAKMIGSRILGLAGQSETRLFVLLMLATAFIGAFVSNTGTVSIILPIVVSMAHAAGLQSSRFLMPLAFAGSMGGMLTLIGTPPNLIVRDALVEATDGAQELGFFSFTPIGLICIVVGTALLVPLSKRFLNREAAGEGKKNKGKSLRELAEEYRLGDRLTVLTVPEASAVVGQTAKTLRASEDYGVSVVEIRRHSQKAPPLARRVEQFSNSEVPIEAGDVLYVSGKKDAVSLFASELGLSHEKKGKGRGKLQFYQVGIAELLLLPQSALVGKTVKETDYRRKYGLNVLGVRRHSDYLMHDVGDVRLHASDVLLVQGPWETVGALQSEESLWIVLGQPLEEARRVTLDYKAPVAALIMLLMVLAMSIDSIPVEPVTAVVCAAVLMIFTGCLRNMQEAYRCINWESIVLFAAMLPMSIALDKTDISSTISSGLVSTFGNNGPYMLLAAVYVATSFMTFFISNTVTAVLMAPIALKAACEQGWSATPFLMAVTVAASMCFASPFSTPPNALVMSAGGYRPIDYVKVGLPLQVVMGIVMVLCIPLLFPF